MSASNELAYLFGGPQPWNTTHWTASDDRVRGGSSVSHLTPKDHCRVAIFHGHLDTSTLGGAGFASQRTIDDAAGGPWDLSQFDCIRLRVLVGEKNTCIEGKYTFVLKDKVLPKRPDGRESSSVSWEAEFECPKEIMSTSPVDIEIEGEQFNLAHDIILPFKSFKATYRGKPKPDAEPLDLSSIKRISIMMRSFFDQQRGDFSIVFHSIAAMQMPKHERADEKQAKNTFFCGLTRLFSWYKSRQQHERQQSSKF